MLQALNMRMKFALDLNGEANLLLEELVSRYEPSHGLGHMSPSIYDTAWVSMVSKNNQWLFPSTFQYILDHQSESGGWESPSEIDTILNTLSALLSLQYHSKDGNFSDRITRAEHRLSFLLNSWDISATERVGFEITVPSILSLLSAQSVNFSFPCHSKLMELNANKLSKFKPQLIYQCRTPLLHSLEGLIGHIDFDQVAHHKRHGNFMASPSSTAAFLMHASSWDDECEAYLRKVLSQYEICGATGSLPCAWPTTYFELSWIICNLQDGGFDFAELDRDSLNQVSMVLKKGIEAGKGTIGFAPEVEADADDSSKVITALIHLGISTPVEPLCNAFEIDSHFQCYPQERNPSITVQCNVLSALLESAERYLSGKVNGAHGCDADLEISVWKAVAFISETWWTTNEEIVDKWHNSTYYVLLLIAQSLTKFMLLFDKGYFPGFPELVVQTKAPIALFQILTRLLQARTAEGSWGSCEETAYALLALTKLASLPFVSVMHETIQEALDSGREFILANMNSTQDTIDQKCLWLDKIAYRIPPISYSYILAALQATSIPLEKSGFVFPGEISRLILIPTKRIHGFLHFYRKMPMFRDCHDWQLMAYIAEGYLYLPILEEVRTAVFGREGMGKEPYTEYIPFSWTSANAMYKKYSCPQNCFVLMTVSLINFQVDEFFDSMVQDKGTAALPALRQALDEIFGTLDRGKDITHLEFSDRPYSSMIQYMHKYICFIINYPTSQKASHYDKGHLQRELKAYLLSMIQQTEDNTIYSAQTSWETFLTPASSYLKWVRTLGSEHISGFASSSLFLCHLSPYLDVFPTPELKFIAQDCITHMCVLCRIWNDWGSMLRDIAERNINGMNFPEFAGMSESEIKAEMRRISDYERRCLHRGLDELRKRAKELMGDMKGDKWADAFCLFFRGAEVYNAIYELKDISAWKLSLLNGH